MLRYGQLYGPGSHAQTPWDFAPVHVDAAAYAALLAIDRGGPGENCDEVFFEDGEIILEAPTV